MVRMKEKIWNIPNVLTMLRIALIGVFIWQYAQGKPFVALAVFVVAGMTDYLDGYIARKRNLITSFGKLMDPLADKLMLITVLYCLMMDGLVPMWLVVVVVAKELLMVLGGYFLYREGHVVQARTVGKVAQVVFVAAVVTTFLHEYVAPVNVVLLYVAAALSICAMVWYMVDVRRRIQKK